MMTTRGIKLPCASCAVILSVALLLCGIAAEVRADGTEILDDPLGLNLAPGTDVIIAGVGLRDGQPAAINLTVPAGATVQQVLIYWEGQDETEAGQNAGATITWITDQPASSQVFYGPTVAYENGSVNDPALVTAHSLILSGPAPGTLYHYRVSSTNLEGVTTSTADATFLMPSNDPSAADDSYSMVQDDLLVTDATSGVLANDSDPQMGPLSAALVSDVSSGSLTLNADGSFTYAPDPGFSGNDVFTYQATDGGRTSATATVFLGVTHASLIVSDDFNVGCALPGHWTFVDPLGDGGMQFTGTGTSDAFLELSVPAGTSHDVWGSIPAPRLMQTASDTDFEIEVKFESLPSVRYQGQGIIIEEGPSDFLRFDFYSPGGILKLFAASFVGGSPAVHINTGIVSGAPIYMRVRREGDQWTLLYSFDGQSWTIGTSFTHVLSVTSVGVFVMNHESPPSNSPAYTAVVDYFFNTAAPVMLEDGSADAGEVLTVNVAGSGSVTRVPDQPTYACGELVVLTAVPDPGHDFGGWGGAATGTTNPVTVTMDANLSVTADFVPGIGTLVISDLQVNVHQATDTDTITLNGTEAITGDRIGGPTLFFSNAWTSSYRKDITSLGLVAQGANTITVEGMDFSRANNGAGILVIVDDGTDPADIQIKDGNDCAFVNFAPPLDITEPATFNFAPADIERTARISLFVGSVALGGPPSSPGRPSVVDIEIDGVLTEQLVDVLDSSDGNEWDSLSHTATIPAFATSLTVQLLSIDAGTGRFAGGLPASMTWITASFAMTTPPGEGCTPGYWKQPHHFDNWAAPFTPGMLFADVFEDAFPGITLLDVLQQGGGGLNALGRHTVAALLNAESADVSYDLAVGEVIGLFNDAFPGSKPEYNILKNSFEELNELGCPFGRAAAQPTSGGPNLMGRQNGGKRGYKAVLDI